MSCAGPNDHRAGRLRALALAPFALVVAHFAIVARAALPEMHVERTARRAATSASLPPLAEPRVGVGSCSSVACHGSSAPAGAKGSEYTTWGAHDRHARAYEVLTQPHSERIARLYRGRADARAESDRLCLGCHVAEDAGQWTKSASSLLADGVGCESCHGAAGRWLAPHTTFGWSAQSDDQKRLLGFRPLKSLPDRADACVGCHVGRPGVEVNHDLIAAGHPRLGFELSAFLAMMPHHWDERADRARDPDFEARAWAIGQVRSARAALELLAGRAQASSETSEQATHAPWPELSEYGCFACHHDLRGGTPAIGQGRTRALGSPPWGTWYTRMLRTLAGQEPSNARAQAALTQLDALERLMASPGSPSARVAAQAQSAAKALASWTPAPLQQTMSTAQVRGLFTAVASSGARVGPSGWDENTVRYLALAALHKALDDIDPSQCKPGWADALRAMQQSLAFPPRTDSPAATSSADFARALEELKTQIGP